MNKLIIPTKNHISEIENFKNEMIEYNSSFDGTGKLKTCQDINEWLEHTYACMNKETCPENLVTATQYLYVNKEENKIIGMIQIRHELNDFLKNTGGHIGYVIRPTERRNGYAKDMLRQALFKCKKLDINHVLMMCIDSNIGSEKTILNNGGKFFDTYYDPNREVTLKKFWIDL